MGAFESLLVWKVSRLGRDMREVITTVYQLAVLGHHGHPDSLSNRPHHLDYGKIALGDSRMVCRDGE
jgi:hypothetical protein